MELSRKSTGRVTANPIYKISLLRANAHYARS